MFDEKQSESLRRWTLKRSQEIFDEMKKFMDWFYFGFCLLTFNPFLKLTCNTNDRLKLTSQKKMGFLMLEEGDEDAENKRGPLRVHRSHSNP